MKKYLKRALGFTLSAAMAVSMTAVGASATNYAAPTTGVVPNDKIITGTGTQAGSSVLPMLGINQVVTNSAVCVGQVDGSSVEWGSDAPNLGLFGSDINDNPDPYLYNYFYNFNSTKSAGSTWDAADYSAWNATPYTLIGAATSTITITIDGVTKTCSPYFFYEPDVHIVFLQNPAAVLETYQATYNEDYNPLFLDTVSTSAARSDGLGNAYNMFEMSTNMTDIGAAVDALGDSIGKTTRYAESATEIGSNYDKWCRGFYYWAQLMFDVYDGSLTDEEVAELESYGVDIDALGGGLQKVRGVCSASYDADTDSWTIKSTTSRTTQYASGIVEDIYDVLTDEISAGERDDYVLTTDELIAYL